MKGKCHVGCAELLSTVQQRVKPKVHVFGHIHEGKNVVFLHSVNICYFLFEIFRQCKAN